MTNGYSVKVAESSRELTAREKLFVTDTTNAVKLDEKLKDSKDKVKIAPVDYAVLAVHNEKSDNVDYFVYVIFAKDGNKYVTGSNSFWNSFMDIYSVMNESGEEFEIEIYKKESKNYKGKFFLTCSII